MRLLLGFCAAFSFTLTSACDRGPKLAPEVRDDLREWSVDPENVQPSALRAAARDENVRRFYQQVRWQPVWDKERTAELFAAFANSKAHGLDHLKLLADEAPSDPAAREVEITRAALKYAGALANGLVDPARLFEVYTVPRPNTDVAKALSAALASGEPLAEWMESLAPQTDEYRALSAAYLEQRAEAAAGGDRPIMEGDAIEPGERDPRVPRLVEALQENGYLGDLPAERSQPDLYSKEIAAAVARLQADYGTDSDGIVGPATLEVLNASSKDRARQLSVNLERRRWLERDSAPTRIDVNTAAAFLRYFRDGQLRNQRRVVVGQPDWESPELGTPMFRLVANPSWTVPDSIFEKELASKGPGYFAANNMAFKNGRLVQLPGPKNSLGQVKFDLRNDHAIYLHDTPHKALFAQARRHASHGCSRVHDAVGFARLLADDQGLRSEFEKALATGEESFVPLKREIPVRLLYHSAFLDGGKVKFRADPYGWDEDVAVALGLLRRTRRPLKTHVDDVGP